MDELPSEFDLVVIGTGFSESIVAAAASRIGKSVLHLDPNEFYGSNWASFNLDAFNVFMNCIKEKSTDENIESKLPYHFGVQSVEQKWHINEPKDNELCNEEENESDKFSKEKILQEFRKFNIDLVPKLLFSSGNLVELLITSNISRYAEFRAIDYICTIFENQLSSVPCSRTDVFNSKDLTIVEKRLLMKLLSQCMSFEENREEFIKYEDKTFWQFLNEHNLTDKILHCVSNSISMSDEDTTLSEGMQNVRKFLNGLGRYGNTPFLFPMYGCGELPQCFCRLCAVFGGIYCLKKEISEIEVKTLANGEKIVELRIDKQKIQSKNVVFGAENLSEKFLQQFDKTLQMNKKCGNLARAILIMSSPIGDDELNSGGGGVNFLRIPGDKSGAIVIQLSHYSGTCPKGLYLVHITAKSVTDDPKHDLKPYMNQIFNIKNPPKLLHSTFYKIPKCFACENNVISNSDHIHFTCGPFFELDYDLSIENAKNVFKQMFPDEEFLPRAPDPEEIVMGDEDPTAPSALLIAGEEIVLENIKEKPEKVENDNENQLS